METYIPKNSINIPVEQNKEELIEELQAFADDHEAIIRKVRKFLADHDN